LLENPANTREREAFTRFSAELRDDLNDSITDGEIIEMLAQHLITKPVFDALFEGYSFAQHNPMSQAMQGVLDVLQEHRLEKEADTLESFYASVKMRAEGIDSAAGKQKIIIELYDKFFRNAFPKMTERLGIVYTPVEVVDFILHSVAHILQTEFGQTLGSKGVHIIDPFTGTGTFITRLLQSGLIKPEELPHKYRHEIHANEIVLLAYYIAAINIEAVYHSLLGGEYLPFEGICLTDTFQMYEKEDLVDALLVDNSKRRKRQKQLDIRIIVGNPPYSVGQENANDVNQNVVYKSLDDRIRATYAARASVSKVRSLYDSYIRAIRWASDRVGESGIIGFVTNAGYIESNSASGVRKCLAEEFSNVYVFHLRGNQRTSGELSRREGGKIFGGGSRAPIAISLLVKNPRSRENGRIRFYDIGDYHSREDKLRLIADLGSIAGITSADWWTSITPDEHGDWLKQRDDSFSDFIPIGDKTGTAVVTLFESYSSGVQTKRDAWCINPSPSALRRNMESMIGVYNTEAKRLDGAFIGLSREEQEQAAMRQVITDPGCISWTSNLLQSLIKGKIYSYSQEHATKALIRPFSKAWMYSDKAFVWSRYLMPQTFPSKQPNRAIMIKSRWTGQGQLALMIDCLPEFQSDGGAQCFPLYLYSVDRVGTGGESAAHDLFTQPPEEGCLRRDAITDAALAHFSSAYPGETICKEDLFYYAYGLLHSSDYRERFADNLGKELPRIPRVKAPTDFWAFSRAGRDLAELHLNYETVPMYPDAKIEHGGKPLTDADYRVEKMRHGKKGKDKDLTTVVYNHRITVTGIPVEAYDYVVNGKPAIEWVMERQCVKTDKASGIVSDANDWAIETIGNPRYPLELLLRVVTVSLETMKIVRSLPALEIGESPACSVLTEDVGLETA
jgi:predicted helicase